LIAIYSPNSANNKPNAARQGYSALDAGKSLDGGGGGGPPPPGQNWTKQGIGILRYPGRYMITSRVQFSNVANGQMASVYSLGLLQIFSSVNRLTI